MKALNGFLMINDRWPRKT